ncbi:MAG: prepilin-type N-terminal cleavage/methylation domain-containing protein [Candidatus Staskawiczbacteria bacterium]|nr:prepilin-type N-terminal cleavage/methylation domain-containing protein [Candidatus Staskawiczbacteria bacterium]
MNPIKNKKGFTIIELIVVIAIIAVLAAIVLVNVTGYINKGRDAAITANLGTLITNASDYFYNNSGKFGTDYVGTTIFTTTVSAAITNAKGALTQNGSATTQDWCACSTLNNSPYNVLCVDNRGLKRLTTTGVLGTPITCAVACPSSGICDTTK